MCNSHCQGKGSSSQYPLSGYYLSPKAKRDDNFREGTPTQFAVAGPHATARPGLMISLARTTRPALASCGGVTNVSNQAQLNAGIADFNSQGSPCHYTIALASDIFLTASTTTINNPTPDVDLLHQRQWVLRQWAVHGRSATLYNRQ